MVRQPPEQFAQDSGCSALPSSLRAYCLLLPALNGPLWLCSATWHLGPVRDNPPQSLEVDSRDQRVSKVQLPAALGYGGAG